MFFLQCLSVTAGLWPCGSRHQELVSYLEGLSIDINELTGLPRLALVVQNDLSSTLAMQAEDRVDVAILGGVLVFSEQVAVFFADLLYSLALVVMQAVREGLNILLHFVISALKSIHF